MLGFLSVAIKAAYAFVLPFTGKVAARVLPWLVPLRPALRAGRWLLVGTMLVAAVAGVVWLAWPDKQVTITQARQLCEDSRLRAELSATKAALATAQTTLRMRAEAITHAETWINDLTDEMEKIRAQAPDPDAPVFAADDPWLHKRPR